MRFNEEEFPLTARPDDAEYHNQPGGKGGGGAGQQGQQQEWFERVFGEEERRLAYVALSRAREELCISYITDADATGGMHSSSAMAVGSRDAPPPSRFLRDVPVATCQASGVPSFAHEFASFPHRPSLLAIITAHISIQ